MTIHRPDGQITHLDLSQAAVNAPFRKNISVLQKRKSPYIRIRPVPPRGVSRSSRTRGGMRWTRRALLTKALEADGEVVWSWRPDAGVKSRGIIPARRRWQKSPITGESTKETVKTIARGMPGDTGVTVVTTLVYFVFYRTRGCGRIERPAFPAPSVQEEPDENANLARKPAARSRSCVLPSLRAKRATQVIQTCCVRWMKAAATTLLSRGV